MIFPELNNSTPIDIQLMGTPGENEDRKLT